jgi:hypothetical protein
VAFLACRSPIIDFIFIIDEEVSPIFGDGLIGQTAVAA